MRERREIEGRRKDLQPKPISKKTKKNREKGLFFNRERRVLFIFVFDYKYNIAPVLDNGHNKGIAIILLCIGH